MRLAGGIGTTLRRFKRVRLLKKFSIVKVYRNKSDNKVIGALVMIGKQQYKLNIADLYRLKRDGYTIDNAILTKNGVIRAKRGNLSSKYVEQKETRSLKSYQNRKIYDGNTEKFGVTINGIDYIAKFPKEPGDFSVFSEHVASSFMRKLGYNAHTTKLHRDSDGRVAVLMVDFTTEVEKLRSHKDTKQSSEETDIERKLYTYDDILDMLSKHKKLSEKEKQRAIRQFWDMYMLDAILANRDRHHGNWGYLTKDNRYRVAPIYDNGASLFPNVSDKLNDYAKDRKRFLEERSERFPASLLCVFDETLRRPKRTNYYEFIGKHSQYTEMDTAYNKIKSLGVERVFLAAREAAHSRYVPKNLCSFYVDIIVIRYLHIIDRLSFERSYDLLNRLIAKYGGV